MFGALVAAAAIAVGLAFGLGGQETARKWLSRVESTVSTAGSQLKAQQPLADGQSSTQPQQMRQFR